MVADDRSATDALRRGRLLPQYAATLAGMFIFEIFFPPFSIFLTLL